MLKLKPRTNSEMYVKRLWLIFILFAIMSCYAELFAQDELPQSFELNKRWGFKDQAGKNPTLILFLKNEKST